MEAVPVREEEIPYTIEVVAEHLHIPWALDIAEDGRIFLTERPGQVRVIQDGKLREEPLISFPAPFVSKGEGGLLGLVLDPEFSRNHYLYVYHSYQEAGNVKNRVIRLVERENRLFVDSILLDGIPGNVFHNGGRLKFGPDGYLYITAGDALDPNLAQDLNSLAGKILRIRPDGTIPDDNPFAGSPVYSWGHRNPQGLSWHPEIQQLFSSEHGQSAHDELNRLEAGANYGWPVIEGDQQSSEPAVSVVDGVNVTKPLQRPVLHSGGTTWAPSGMTFVTRGPWKNQLLIANLRGQQILKVTLDPSSRNEVKQVESLFRNRFGRIRTVMEGADGSLYFVTNNRDGRGRELNGDDRLIRLIPKRDESKE
ncbi:MAG: PQQ-dependent sugar dehydrogenase [Bacillaceae bacterium]|nr:PQQ-dependent sugar dehydrogenase [Bacillaceae bacterium]